MSILYSLLDPAEAEAAMAVVTASFNAFVAPEYSKQGCDLFYSVVTADYLRALPARNGFSLVAKQDGAMVGLCSVRDGHHITLFFVAPASQGMGIGRRLFDEAVPRIRENAPNAQAIEVHSSLVAVPVYQALGFQATGPEQTEDGIRFVPMMYMMCPPEALPPVVQQHAWANCLAVLRALVEKTAVPRERETFEQLVATIYKRARKQRRVEVAKERRAEYQQALAPFLDPAAQPAPDCEPTTEPTTVAWTRPCYTCHQRYHRIHPRYPFLCPDCAHLNETKRSAPMALAGRRALVTGGRVKIGRATALRLLRGGAEVVATSRHPDEALAAYQREPDFEVFKHRLHTVGLDFRAPAAVEQFALDFLHRFGPLDILINNAAQSVVRAWELAGHAPPPHDDDVDDQREENSWTMALEDVPVGELVDVLMVNSAAPFLLTGRLKAAMQQSAFPDRYVVNVVGLDGRFDCSRKTPFHPHVNVSKAALNMLTRTAAEWLARDGIHMNSVDVGWVTHEGPQTGRERARLLGIRPPFDPEDAAARICDPIAAGLAGAPVAGQIFRDYQPTTW